MSTRLCQIIAVEKSVKNKAHEVTTAAYQKMEKVALLSGLSRTYRPKDEEGEKLPSESNRVQVNAIDLFKTASKAWGELFDVTATKDFSNCEAKADVTVGDVVVAKDVPVTYLLFLEKKLVDVHTFISKLPTLDPSEDWSLDPNVNCYASKVTETTRTKKTPRVLTKAVATDKHAAQVEVYQEDVTVGFWSTVKFSGALPAAKVAEMLERVEKLQKSVKFAREEANSREVTQPKVGEKLFAFIAG